jgi:tetratricopeptide (TPR) repeat protein
MKAACNIFYGIYDNGRRSTIISNLLQRLDFHPLSIALLATTASHNMWDYDRLVQEWDARRTQVLRTDYNESLAATIDLSLTSPTFRKLGPNARDLLSVIAFFPQGIDKNNLDWFFPTISERRNIFDKFGVLSLTYQSNGFITMLAPLRDYLCPQDPTSSPLLHTTKECYLRRLAIHVNPGEPGYKEAQWIVSEDVNVEHLLDVFTSIDSKSDNIWDACTNFMRHLYWHKRRLVVLGPKLEQLPDNHPSKPKCLFQLSRLFDSVGNPVEYKRLLVYTLKLWRERGDDIEVAQTLRFLAHMNQQPLHYKEGILQAKESLGISKQLNDTLGQVRSLQQLAWLFSEDNQLDAAEKAATQSIHLLPDSEQFLICQGHRVLGSICHSKGKTEKAVNHYNTALKIASSSNWDDQQFSVLCSLAELFHHQGKFGKAHTHVQHAKLFTTNDTYLLGQAMKLQVQIWYKQGRLKEAKSEALGAVSVFEKLGAAKELEGCRKFLQRIEEDMKNPISPGKLGSNGELLAIVLFPTLINSPSLAQGTK